MPAPSPADSGPPSRPAKASRERRKRPESLLAGLDLGLAPLGIGDQRIADGKAGTNQDRQKDPDKRGEW